MASSPSGLSNLSQLFRKSPVAPNSQLPRMTKEGLGMLRFDCFGCVGLAPTTTHLLFFLKRNAILKLRQSGIFPNQFSCESEETTNTTKHLSLQTFTGEGGRGGRGGGRGLTVWSAPLLGTPPPTTTGVGYSQIASNVAGGISHMRCTYSHRHLTASVN